MALSSSLQPTTDSSKRSNYHMQSTEFEKDIADLQQQFNEQESAINDTRQLLEADADDEELQGVDNLQKMHLCNNMLLPSINFVVKRLQIFALDICEELAICRCLRNCWIPYKRHTA